MGLLLGSFSVGVILLIGILARRSWPDDEPLSDQGRRFWVNRYLREEARKGPQR